MLAAERPTIDAVLNVAELRERMRRRLSARVETLRLGRAGFRREGGWRRNRNPSVDQAVEELDRCRAGPDGAKYDQRHRTVRQIKEEAGSAGRSVARPRR
jgi:hypothetical protein